MTSSTRHPQTWSGALLALSGAVVTTVLTAALLSACEPGQKQPSAAPQPRTDVTATAGATTHDGATLAAGNGSDCNTDPGKIRSILGPVADHLQTAALVKDVRDGTVEITCTYALAPYPDGQEPDPGNALTISRTLYPDQATLDKASLPRLMMTPQPAQGPWDRGWYSLNQLSATAEDVLETVQDKTVTRLTLAVPLDTPPIDKAQEKLTVLTTLLTTQK